MHATDLIGCIASGLVLLTFYMNDMITLRTIALCSNVAFIVYAASLHLTPILLLHSILIPINLWRLIAALRANDFYGRLKYFRNSSACLDANQTAPHKREYLF